MITVNTAPCLKIAPDRFETGGDLEFLRNLKNGSEYEMFYMMLGLCIEDRNGEIPARQEGSARACDIDRIVSDCRYFTRDTVKVAMSLFRKTGLISEDAEGILRVKSIQDIFNGSDNYNKTNGRNFNG